MSGSGVENALLKQSVGRPRPQLFLPETSTDGLPARGLGGRLGVSQRPRAEHDGDAGRACRAALATRWQWRTIALGAPLVGAVGLSRVYLGIHLPSDALAGSAVALTWMVGVELAPRRHTRRPARPH